MTQSADAPARERVYQILRNAARPSLELRPETLRSRAALLFERIYNSFILLQKIKEPHRHRIALYTAITLYAEHAGALHREPDFPPDTCRFRVPLGRTFLPPAHARCGVRRFTDLRWSLPTLDGHWRSTCQRGRWETASLQTKAKASHSATKTFSEPPTPGECSPGTREHGQRLPHPALGAPQGDA